MKKKIFFLVVFVLIVGGTFFFFSRKLKIEAVNCKNGDSGCSKEVSKLVDEYKGQNYFTAKRSLSKSLSKEERVISYQIGFLLPSTLNVSLVEKKPEVALKFGETRYFLFDKDGSLAGESDSVNLPFAEVIDTPKSESVHFAAILFRDLVKYYGVKSATLDKFGLVANIYGNSQITFPIEGDIDVILGSLEVVLLQLNKSSENSTMNSSASKTYEVDLRYKNPVVKEV